jgi:plastocyanin
MRTLLAAAVLLSAFSGAAGAQSPTLTATVGPGFQIRLADGTGNAVTHIDPGTYTIQVEDKAAIHNFHLTGPGVDQATDIEQTGSFVWTVTFVDGRYHYQCDAHPTTMKGDFTVGTAPATTTTTPAPKPISLGARVGPGPTIAVTRAGARLKTLAAGPVVVVVRDRSAKDNFHLAGPGVNRVTSRPGKSTVTWRLTLKRGLYTYRSDATPSLRGSFRAV